MRNQALKLIFVFCLLSALGGFELLSADTLFLTLDKAISLALQNNRLIAQTKEKIAEAAALKGIAFSALLPQINASGTYYRTDRLNKFTMAVPIYDNLPLPVINPLTGETIGFTPPIPIIIGADTLTMALGARDNYLLRGTIQQTLFTWGKLWHAYQIAGISLDIEKEGLKRTEAEVKVSVVEGFYQTFLAQKTVELLEESQKQLKRHWERVRLLYEKGLANRLDFLRTEVKLAEMEVSLSRMKNNAQLALASFRSTLGLEEIPIVLSVTLEPDEWSVDLDSAIKTAGVQRPEIQQLRSAIEIARRSKQIALSSNLPTLFSQLNYDYKKPIGLENKWGTDWNLTIGFTMPIFAGFSNLAKIRQSQARERQARLSLALVEEGIKMEVQALVNTLNQEMKNIETQKKNLLLAKEALSLAEKSYENGLITNLEYLDCSLTLYQSQISYWQSLANYQIVKAKLKKAIGEF
ncbi:MAG: TolC family protein [candidate division WOR-3 bacterium]